MQVDLRDLGLIPGSGRSPGGGHGNPPQYSCLENPMDREACWATVYRVAKSQTWLKWLSMHACMKCKVLFFKLVFIGTELLYHDVLVSTVQQKESARHLCWTCAPSLLDFFPRSSPQRVNQSSLCHVVCSHYLPVLYTVSIVYIMSIPISQFLPPHHPFPLVSTGTILFAKQNRHTDVENKCRDTAGCSEVRAELLSSVWLFRTSCSVAL